MKYVLVIFFALNMLSAQAHASSSKFSPNNANLICEKNADGQAHTTAVSGVVYSYTLKVKPANENEIELQYFGSMISSEDALKKCNDSKTELAVLVTKATSENKTLVASSNLKGKYVRILGSDADADQVYTTKWF